MSNTIAGCRNAYILIASSSFFEERKRWSIFIYFILIIVVFVLKFFEGDENLIPVTFFDVDPKMFIYYQLLNAFVFFLSKIIFIYLLRKAQPPRFGEISNGIVLFSENDIAEQLPENGEMSNRVNDDIQLLSDALQNSETSSADISREISASHKFIIFSFYIINWLLLLSFTDILGLHISYQNEIVKMDSVFSISLLVHAIAKPDQRTFIALVMRYLEKTKLTFKWDQKFRFLTFATSFMIIIYLGYYRLLNSDQNFFIYVLLTIAYFLTFFVHLSYFGKIFFSQIDNQLLPSSDASVDQD